MKVVSISTTEPVVIVNAETGETLGVVTVNGRSELRGRGFHFQQPGGWDAPSKFTSFAASKAADVRVHNAEAPTIGEVAAAVEKLEN